MPIYKTTASACSKKFPGSQRNQWVQKALRDLLLWATEKLEQPIQNQTPGENRKEWAEHALRDFAYQAQRTLAGLVIAMAISPDSLTERAKASQKEQTGAEPDARITATAAGLHAMAGNNAGAVQRAMQIGGLGPDTVPGQLASTTVQGLRLAGGLCSFGIGLVYTTAVAELVRNVERLVKATQSTSPDKRVTDPKLKQIVDEGLGLLAVFALRPGAGERFAANATTIGGLIRDAAEVISDATQFPMAGALTTQGGFTSAEQSEIRACLSPHGMTAEFFVPGSPNGLTIVGMPNIHDSTGPDFWKTRMREETALLAACLEMALPKAKVVVVIENQSFGGITRTKIMHEYPGKEEVLTQVLPPSVSIIGGDTQDSTNQPPFTLQAALSGPTGPLDRHKGLFQVAGLFENEWQALSPDQQSRLLQLIASNTNERHSGAFCRWAALAATHRDSGGSGRNQALIEALEERNRVHSKFTPEQQIYVIERGAAHFKVNFEESRDGNGEPPYVSVEGSFLMGGGYVAAVVQTPAVREHPLINADPDPEKEAIRWVCRERHPIDTNAQREERVWGPGNRESTGSDMSFKTFMEEFRRRYKSLSEMLDQ